VSSPPNSNPDPRLAELVAKLKTQEAGLRVLSARVYALPYARLRVNIMAHSPRRLAILPEFVLRAAGELEPPPTRDELAVLLGLDELFVQAACEHLEQLRAIVLDAQGRLSITPLGREFYAQRTVPSPPEPRVIELAYLGATDELAAWATWPDTDEDDPVLPGCLDQTGPLMSAASAAATLPRVIAGVANTSLGLHAPEQGRRIIQVKAATVEGCGYYTRGVLAVQDTDSARAAAANASLRAYCPATGERDAALERALSHWLQQGRLTLAQLQL